MNWKKLQNGNREGKSIHVKGQRLTCSVLTYINFLCFRLKIKPFWRGRVEVQSPKSGKLSLATHQITERLLHPLPIGFGSDASTMNAFIFYVWTLLFVKMGCHMRSKGNYLELVFMVDWQQVVIYTYKNVYICIYVCICKFQMHLVVKISNWYYLLQNDCQRY